MKWWPHNATFRDLVLVINFKYDTSIDRGKYDSIIWERTKLMGVGLCFLGTSFFLVPLSAAGESALDIGLGDGGIVHGELYKGARLVLAHDIRPRSWHCH